MPYCINCGNSYYQKPSICEKCLSDPSILEDTLDQKLKKFASNPLQKKDEFSYFGEKTSLAFSFLILAVLTAALGMLSFGLFFVLIIVSLTNLFITNIRNKGLMIQVGSDNFPDLFRLVKVVCFRLKIPLLPVYIAQNQDYNAYTQGFLKNAWVVINSSLVEDFTPTELAFVLGHEFAHAKKRHTTWLTLMSPASNIRASIVSGIVRTIFNLWSLKCEHTADRGGLVAVRNVDAAISALGKLAAGKTLGSQIDWQKLVKDHEEKDNILLKAAELLGTHPFPVRRIKEVHAFSQSQKYRSILQKELTD